MEKLNIAEILKDYPTGMELDSTLFEGLEFDCIVDNEYLPIRCRIKHPNGGYTVYNFTKYGCWLDTTFAKCVIFPKGKTTWEGFQRPFKDGDVVVSKRGDIHLLWTLDSSYCAYREYYNNKLDCTITTGVNVARLATEEEKQKLFKAIKDNGYCWNAETKTLEKLIVPKFKAGDTVKHKQSGVYCTVGEYAEGLKGYHTSIGLLIPDNKTDEWEIMPDKFDINILKPFDKVLVRISKYDKWCASFFSHIDKEHHSNIYGYVTVNSTSYPYCVPYDGNEHLRGTTDDCSNFYKTWE